MFLDGIKTFGLHMMVSGLLGLGHWRCRPSDGERAGKAEKAVDVKCDDRLRLLDPFDVEADLLRPAMQSVDRDPTEHTLPMKTEHLLSVRKFENDNIEGKRG